MFNNLVITQINQVPMRNLKLTFQNQYDLTKRLSMRATGGQCPTGLRTVTHTPRKRSHSKIECAVAHSQCKKTLPIESQSSFTASADLSLEAATL